MKVDFPIDIQVCTGYSIAHHYWSVETPDLVSSLSKAISEHFSAFAIPFNFNRDQALVTDWFDAPRTRVGEHWRFNSWFPSVELDYTEIARSIAIPDFYVDHNSNKNSYTVRLPDLSSLAEIKNSFFCSSIDQNLDFKVEPRGITRKVLDRISGLFAGSSRLPSELDATRLSERQWERLQRFHTYLDHDGDIFSLARKVDKKSRKEFVRLLLEIRDTLKAGYVQLLNVLHKQERQIDNLKISQPPLLISRYSLHPQESIA